MSVPDGPWNRTIKGTEASGVSVRVRVPEPANENYPGCCPLISSSEWDGPLIREQELGAPVLHQPEPNTRCMCRSNSANSAVSCTGWPYLAC